MAILTRGLAERIERANAGMYPGYFALVMATGIVSTALFLEGVRVVSQLLLWINLAAYPVLIAATARRGVRYGAKLWADLSNPQTVFTFFTFVAASDVLGVQLFLRGIERLRWASGSSRSSPGCSWATLALACWCLPIHARRP